MKLPSGYKRLAYIQSSGTQYVDTEYVPNSNTKVVADVQFLSKPTDHAAVFGARSSNTLQYWVYYRYSVDSYAYRYGEGNTDVRIPHDATARVTVTTEANVVTVNGETGTATEATFTAPCNMTLFAINNNGSLQYQSTLRLYSCKIYDNGTLVRDYVPCLNPSGVAGLYDLVNGKFYGNAGTGTFAVGRRVYDESEIAKLAYIESNGTQYVDTDFKPNNNTKVVASVQFATEPTTHSAIFGARGSNTAQCWAYYDYIDKRYTGRVGTDAYGVTIPFKATDRALVTLDKNTLFVNDQKIVAANETFTSPYALWLFCTNNYNQVQYPGAFKLYSCKIYDNSVLVRDYYPAMVDGLVGLWDAVSGILYTDATGGTFAYGRKVYGESDVQLLEYIESTGEQYVDTGLITAARNMKIISDVMFKGATGARQLMGANAAYYFGISADGYYEVGTEGSVKASTSTFDAIEFERIASSGSTLKVNGAAAASRAVTTTNNDPIYLFALGDEDGTNMYFCSCKLKQTNIYLAGVLAREYHPAIADGAVGLWDALTGEFYPNAGTGVFISGPAIVTESPIATLIYDRDISDYNRAEYLAALDYRDMTEEERAEWDADPKGAYNASDLNRVESTVKYLAGELKGVEPELKEYAAERDVHWDTIFAPPYDGTEINPSTKTNWQKSDDPKPSDMTRYLGNVKLLRGAIDYATDELPESVEEITWSGANAIERALMGLDSAIIVLRSDKKTLIDNTAEAWFFSGEIFSGEV